MNRRKPVKALAILAALLLLSACDQRMSNEEIIAEIKKCKDAGLIPHPMVRALNPSVISFIQCFPKEPTP